MGKDRDPTERVREIVGGAVKMAQGASDEPEAYGPIAAVLLKKALEGMNFSEIEEALLRNWKDDLP